MVQEQLVDYISSQMKLGVSVDAIKAALMGAGWAVEDVNDTFAKINAGNGAVQPAPMPAAKPVAVAVANPEGMGASAGSVSAGSSNAGFGGRPAVTPARPSGEPQTIRVSDLVSSSPSSFSSPSPSPATAVAPVVTPITKTVSPRPMVAPVMAVQGSGMVQASAGNKGKGSRMAIVWFVFALIFAAAAGYLFFLNMGLTAKTAAPNVPTQSDTSSLTAQITSLQAQVSADNTSSTNLSAQVASITADDQNARANLSLFVAPVGAPATANITLSGTVTGGKPIFILLTGFGARAYVKNSTDTNVIAALDPLLGSATTAQLTGTYMPGTPYLTLTAVNGNPIAPVAATSTPTQ